MAKSSTSFTSGKSGNPGGKPVGARNRVTTAFLEALATDFAEHGQGVIEEARKIDPVGYMRVCASLVPKDLNVSTEDNAFLGALKAISDTRKWITGQLAEETVKPQASPSVTH